MPSSPVCSALKTCCIDCACHGSLISIVFYDTTGYEALFRQRRQTSWLCLVRRYLLPQEHVKISARRGRSTHLPQVLWGVCCFGSGFFIGQKNTPSKTEVTHTGTMIIDKPIFVNAVRFCYSTNVRALPDFPARPVRPMRCT